jgi:hypothetical protein
MANHIYSRVTIEPEGAMDKICNMIENMPSATYGQETKVVVETFYTKDEISAPYNKGETEYPITEKGVLHGWLYDNVGTKWIQVGIDDDIRIESPAYIPDGFLIKIYSLCCEEFENVSLTCKWWDETETQCGTAVIYDGVYTEDEETLETENLGDPGYYVSGDEELGEVKEWMLSQINENSYTKKEEVEAWSDDELRDTFEQWTNESKWEYISDKWENMRDSCLEAIQTEDFEFPITKVKRIATRHYKMIEKCYPF